MSSYQPYPNSEIAFSAPTRPRFDYRKTDDRLREGISRPAPLPMISTLRKDRTSMFIEVGLDTDTDGHATYTNGGTDKKFAELTGIAPAGTDEASEHKPDRSPGGSPRGPQSPGSVNSRGISPQSPTSRNRPWYSMLVAGHRPRIKTAATAPAPNTSTFTRLSSVALLVALVLPGFSYYNGHERVGLSGADAGVIIRNVKPAVETRVDSPVDVCKRWSHQAAQLNGTLYIYGGQAKTVGDQTQNTWNNDFLILDLTKSWDTASPALSALPQPSGPPAVANGYLWNDYNSLYLYGGEFADNPYVSPAPVSTWQYDIRSGTWIEYSNPQTSAGVDATDANIPVQRAAEGAGISIPELGVSYYFGGHLDLSTTPGWASQVARLYLKSLLEFTHPGFTNDAVASLADGTGAGAGGVYRNITQGGLQVTDAFSERADGALVFVPGWGEKGVLIGLAGGTNDTFVSDLSTLDVFDIANSVWYHQNTTGTPPGVRVNPCAVIASAPDASSFQIYLFGGQDLVPYGDQTQYSDMYILSIPSFTWVEAPQGGTNKPSGRSGHTCNLRDGQMVLVGGYTVPSTDCDQPGIYVFNASSLEWTTRFTALSHPADLDPANSVLADSFGYTVPDAVASVIGGGPDGGATATAPAAGKPSAGPFATGKSPVFTVTASGSTATVTAAAAPGVTASGGPTTNTNTTSSSSSSSSAASSDRQPSGGLIAAGVVAGLAGLLALYLGYCAWLYRRQVRAYKAHLAVANRYSAPRGEPMSEKGAGAAGGRFFVRRGSIGGGEWREDAVHRRDESTSSTTADSFAWVDTPGRQSGGVEPTLLLFDEGPVVDSGYGSTPYGAVGRSGAGVVAPTAEAAVAGVGRRRGSDSAGSSGSAEGLLDGQEPSFFNVVLGPRRALRVVNGLEGEDGVRRGNSGRSERVRVSGSE